MSEGSYWATCQNCDETGSKRYEMERKDGEEMERKDREKEKKIERGKDKRT